MDAEQQKADDAFQAGFNSVSGDEPPAQETVAEVVAPTETVEAEQAPEPLEEAGEQPVFAGFTESELKSLLARAAKVDELEAQVRKAHGKIGELNGTMQEFRKAPTQTPSVKVPAPEEYSHVESDYADIAAYVNARVGAVESRIQEQAPQQQAAEPAPNMQLELMDHLHEGWREKIGSQDFKLWITTQPDDVRETFESTQKAKELSAVIGKFDAWAGGRDTRQTKSKQRLEQALTPTGTPGKPKTAPSAEDAFLEGFKSIMGR